MRRMWMLLLVVALMVIALAVPAMARVTEPYNGCECAMAGRDENGGACHAAGCPEGSSVAWKAWSKTNALPTTTGNYYLTGNVTISGQQSIAKDDQTIFLDLNGYTIQNQDGKNLRLYRFFDAATNASNSANNAPDNCKLVITDSHGNGKMKIKSNYSQGGIIWFGEGSNNHVIMYAGTLDGTEYTSPGTGQVHGSIVCIDAGSCSFMLNGGSILGCNLETLPSGAYYSPSGPVCVVAGKSSFVMNGGVIRGSITQAMHKSNDTTLDFYTAAGAAIFSKGNVTINDGIIYGGTCPSGEKTANGKTTTENGLGGAIYMNGGQLEINNGTINGGTVTGNGGAIYMTGGRLEINDGTINGGTVTGNGGAIYIHNGTEHVISGGTINGSTVTGNGGAIYVNQGQLMIDDGTISGGRAVLGGAIYVNQAQLTFNEGTITGGKSSGNGGNLNVGWNATFTMNDGTISYGESTGDQGGNIFCAGTMSLLGGTISYGKAKNTGGNVIINTSKAITFGEVTITKGDCGSGGNLSFNVNINGNATFNLNGGMTVTDPVKGDNLYVLTNTYNGKIPNLTFNISNCTLADADDNTVIRIQNKVYVPTSGEKGYPTVTVNISGTSVIGGQPKLEGDNKDKTTVNYTGALLNDSYRTVYTLKDAAAAARASDYVKLISNLENQTVANSCNLDLNGKTLTGLTVTNDAEISLFDNSGSDYSVPKGSVALATGDAADIFNREMTTNTLNIGKNHRYVTIVDNGKVTAHRIYLGVKATTLHPKTADEKAALGYRIALRCDDVLAGYVTGYGANISAGTTVEPVSVGLPSGDGLNNDNSRVIGVKLRTNTTLGETEFTGNAYLTLNNGLGNDNAVVSGGATTSLKTLVEAAFDKYNSFTKTMQDNLDWMVGNFDVMSDWDTTPPVSAEGYAALNNKKILFIGNSYTYWGRCVMAPEGLTLSQRYNDQGLFYQLCKANGINVEVTNWTYGGHNITDTMGVLKDDGTIEGCTQCNGKVHLDDLEDRYYDYVSIQLFYEPAFTKYDGTLLEYLSHTINTFRDANPNVKFLFLVPRDAYSERLSHYEWADEEKNHIDTLKAEGFLICNWGDMIYDVEIGDTAVPGATLNYSQSSFVISQSAGDGHHQNMLVGYLTALMAYSAITGDSAEGQPYYFCDDPTINSVFDLEAYKAKYYKHTPTDADEKYEKLWPNGYVETNFVEIMRSEADMAGLQSLVDDYLAQYN